MPCVGAPSPESVTCPSPVCPLKRSFTLLTGSAEVILWDFLCLLPQSGSHLLGISISGFSGTLGKTVSSESQAALQEGTCLDQDAFEVCGLKLRFV